MLQHINRQGALKNVSQSSVRYITIQPATTITTQPVSLESFQSKSNNDDISKLPIVDYNTVESISSSTFKTIGTPASSLSVIAPPSIPVHVKKGSLMSIYSFAKNTNNSIKSKWEFIQPLRRFWLTGDTSSYQSIIGTVPLQLLVSAYDQFDTSKSSGTKTFVNLTLDGSVDWILFETNSLQCYTGASLNVKIESLPKQLHYGYKGRGYAWLNGRGLVSVAGNGNIFKVGLGVGEEIRVERSKIFAISVKELAELNNENCIKSEIWNSVDGLFHEKKGNTTNTQTKLEPKSIKLFNNKIVDETLTITWKYIKSMNEIFQSGKSKLLDYVIGNGQYVVIKGPRTVLIETGSGRDNFVVRSNELLTNKDNIEELEKIVKQEQEWSKPDSQIGDNLGVVTISNGKATYKNLPNFDEEVKRIEGLKNKK